MMQPRRPSESHNGSYGDFCFYFFPFYFKGTVFSLALIALTLEADGIDPEIN